jgi:hypothetical protein
MAFRQQIEDRLGDAVMASEAGIGVLTGWRGDWAALHLARVIVNCGSMLRIIDAGIKFAPGSQLLDHFSVASIARTAIEAQIMMLYVSDPKIGFEEWEMRRQVFHLHDTVHRIRMFKPTAARDDAATQKTLEALRIGREELLGDLGRDAYFRALTDDQKKRILAGQDFYVGGIRAAVRSIGWDVAEYEFYSTYLSAYIHSSPVSFFRADQHGVDFATVSDFQYGLCGTALAAVSEHLPQLTARIYQLISMEKGL